MTAPPLLADILDLIDEVCRQARAAGCTAAEERAALAILGELIAAGWTSHSRVIEHVVHAIQNDRAQLVNRAAAAEQEAAKRIAADGRRQAATASRKIQRKSKGTHPDPQQGRWDLT